MSKEQFDLLRKLVRPTFVAIFSAILAFVLLGLLVFEKIDRRIEREYLLDAERIFRNTFLGEALMQPGESFTKHVDFYNKIIGWYGFHYHPKRKNAMGPKMRAKFVKRLYQYNMMLDLGKFDIIAVALLESSFNPNAKGDFGETSMFQLKHSAVLQADWFFKKIKSERVTPE